MCTAVSTLDPSPVSISYEYIDILISFVYILYIYSTNFKNQQMIIMTAAVKSMTVAFRINDIR